MPRGALNIWYHVGSKNERPGRTGFAHLFEHMMFQGSKNVPGEYFSVVEELGANLQEGGVNGTTDNDRTNYFATVPSGNLEKLLWLESDRLATLIDGVDQAKLDKQRDIEYSIESISGKDLVTNIAILEAIIKSAAKDGAVVKL